MGQALHRALGIGVYCGILDHLRERVTELVSCYDLIVTTFHHMSEALEILRQTGSPTDKVVGIDTRPTPETMLGIARFSKRSIGLVSTMANTSHMLKYIIYSYHPDWQIEATTIDDPQAILRIARSCDHLVVTHTCTDQVQALTGRSPDLVVNFQIDEQSILFLRQRIQGLQREKMVMSSFGGRLGTE
jgi:GntR family transcriptional regulator